MSYPSIFTSKWLWLLVLMTHVLSRTSCCFSKLQTYFAWLPGIFIHLSLAISRQVYLFKTDRSHLRRLLFLSCILDIGCVGVSCILTTLWKVTGLAVSAVIGLSQLAVVPTSNSFFVNTTLVIAQFSRVRHSLLNVFRIVAPKFNSYVLGGSTSKHLRMHIVIHVFSTGESFRDAFIDESLSSVRQSIMAS